MRFERAKAFLKLFACVLCVAMLAGCAAMGYPSKIEFSSTWVSKDGSKSKDQLYEDQKLCTRDAKIAAGPAFSGQMGGGTGGDMKAFNNCMRAKGWVKE